MALDVTKLARSPQAFRNALLIDTARGPARLADVIDPWQAEDFAALDPGWMFAAGFPVPADQPRFSRVYLERPRGHSKTSDTAVNVAWCLFAAPTKRKGVLAAASKDQASHLKESVEQLVRTNKWLGYYLEVQANTIVNKQSKSFCDVLSSEAHTSWGLLVDFIAIDEITHWKGMELWTSLFSAVPKKENCMLQLISNAGFSGTWQEKLYEQIQVDPAWLFRSLDGPKASWMSKAALEEQQRINPASEYDRLYNNIWTSGVDAAISDEDIRVATVLAGPVKPSEQWRMGHWACAGLDIGVKHDRSAFVVLGVPNQSQDIELALAQSWKPPRGGEVDLSMVERAVLQAHRDFGLSAVYYDPSQAQTMAQRLRRQGLRMIEMTFVPKNLDLMAQSLMMAFREQQVQIWNHRELIRDLRALKIDSRMAGLRLKAVSSVDGHLDLGIAFSIALPAAKQMAANRFRGAPSETMKPDTMKVLSNHAKHGVQMVRPDARRAGWVKH